MDKIVTFLWYDKEAKEAAELYTSLFGGEVTNVHNFENADPDGNDVLTVSFKLFGRDFMGMNAGPLFKFNEAISLMVICEDQAEVDKYWNALTADGGQESQCGWLKDKYGLSWQIIPKQLNELTSDPNPKKAQAASQAMLKMKKIEVDKLQEAYDNA